MKKNQFNWLQISDLHLFNSTNLNVMINAYKELAKEVKPNFLVVTGDFRHKKFNNDYSSAIKFLNEIVKIFGLKKKDIFLVPGNHDVSDFKNRMEVVNYIRTHIEEDMDVYLNYLDNKNSNNLRKSFSEYHDFINKFYNGEVKDNRVKEPIDIMYITWRKRVNLILLNTALISEGKSDEKQIVDINKLSALNIDNSLPSVVIGHHPISCLYESHREMLIHLFQQLNVKAYLCGDKHKLSKDSVEKNNIPNATFPEFVCGKSVIQNKDKYSDLSVIEYKCKGDGRAYVQVYKYEKNNFFESNDFYYNVNKKFNFEMFEPVKNELNPENSKQEDNSETSIDKSLSIWLPDAELAEGKQTRFNDFTKTNEINNFFNSRSPILGIVSIKGMGKTFVLQVKRVRSSRNYYCLPHCETPSIKNNWATERITIDEYDRLKTENIYNDLVNLWKTAIECYIINKLRDDYGINKINNSKLLPKFAELCSDDLYDSLNIIIRNILNICNWSNEIKKNCNDIENIFSFVLKRRKEQNPSAKNIAVFIDKVDQVVRQTNAEPPAECVICKKSEYYNECISSRKCAEYCSSETGCQSKNCCFGCEIFASEKSSSGLRIYEKSNAAKKIHVNIWQYMQLALVDAAGQIFDISIGMVSVFYTIRQEAINCEQLLLGEQNQKIAGKIMYLRYSKDTQQKIFLDCIKNQDPQFLFDPQVSNKKGLEEYAFVGVKGLCHPYCKNSDGTNQKESLFMSIYRHSFDRSRDIQRYGEELTKKVFELKKCDAEHDREESVKKTIEDLAASLAYCSKNAESTINPSYYTEKMRYMPNYWADNDNFERLLSLIDRNLLFEDDIKKICKTINNCKECPSDGCKECKRHPFSMLYNMGYMGYVHKNPNTSKDIEQKFLDSWEIGYFAEKNDLSITNQIAYIIHPALSKTIEQKFNKSFMHFSGFILGKGLTVKNAIFDQLLIDKKQLNTDDFISKYYFKK